MSDKTITSQFTTTSATAIRNLFREMLLKAWDDQASVTIRYGGGDSGSYFYSSPDQRVSGKVANIVGDQLVIQSEQAMVGLREQDIKSVTVELKQELEEA